MNLEQLLQPLASAAGPCGEDLIFSAEFDEIQEARRFEDPSLAQGEWITDIKEADWENVVRICENVLGNKSKDLRICAWLIEARGKLDGLTGLADGYILLERLCRTLWHEIHPQPEDGDLEQRAGVLDWLVNQTGRLIREIPLSNSPKGRFSLIDQESARATAKNIERNPELADELGRNAHVTLEKFEAALKDTPPDHFIVGQRDAERLKSAMAALQAILDLQMGEYAPAFGGCFDTLDDVSRYFRRLAGDTEQLSAVKAASDAGQPIPSETSNHAAPASSLGGPPATREQAIAQLQEIAAFFRRTEPHSPVAYLADKAAKWGRMSLHEWLRTVVKDDSALSRMEELLGVESQFHGQPEG